MDIQCPICKKIIKSVHYVCSRHYNKVNVDSKGKFVLEDQAAPEGADSIYCNKCYSAVPIEDVREKNKDSKGEVSCPRCDKKIDDPQYVDSKSPCKIEYLGECTVEKHLLGKNTYSKPKNCEACKKEAGGDEDEDYSADCIYCENCQKPVPIVLTEDDVKVIPIGLVGVSQSGKTCFKASLRRMLSDSPFYAAPQIKLPSSSFSYSPTEVIRKGRKLPARTTFDGDMNLLPDYIAFSKNGQKYVLIIYDMPGESMPKLDEHPKLKRDISILKNVFILLDPTSSFEKFSINDDENTETSQVDIDTVYQCVLAFIGELNRHKKDCKVAFIVSKVDEENVLCELKKANSEILSGLEIEREANKYGLFQQDEDGTPIEPDYGSEEYDFSKRLADDVVRRFIIDNEIDEESDRGGGRFTNIIDFKDKRNNIKEENVRYFAVSSIGIGAELDPETNVLNTKCKPFRVLDPIMWLIKETDKENK